MILLIIIQSLLLISTLTVNPSTKVLYAQYAKTFNYIKHTYTLFYGSYARRIYNIPVEIDFSYTKTVLTNFDLSDKGVYCGSEDGCDCRLDPVYIYDNTHKYTLETYACTMAFYLTYDDVPTYTAVEGKSDFNLKNNIKYYKEKNTVGLGPNSPFYGYIGLADDKGIVKFNLITSFPHNNSAELISSYGSINTKLTFYQHKIYKSSYSINSEFIGFDNVNIKFGNVEYLTKITLIDYNLPYFANVQYDLYDKIIAQIKAIICLKPTSCEKENDIMLNYDRKRQLSFVFQPHNQNPDFIVNISTSDLFFVDWDGIIKYNILPSNHQDSQMTVGLLFLRVVELQVEYHIEPKNYTLTLAFREFRMYYAYYNVLILMSLVLSVIFLATMMRSCKPIRRVSYAPSYDPQLSVE